jgi:formylglycine-generating enzyme required for sulfatase activity
VWLAGLLALLSTLTSRGAEAAVGEWDGPLSVVLGIPRSTDVDVLQLRSGDSRSVRLAQDVFRLHTAFGEITIPAQWVAGIEFASPDRVLDSIVTVNRNRFSGFLIDPTLKFATAGESGQQSVRKEGVSKLVRRLKPDETAGLRRGNWVQLTGGDFFSGRLIHPGPGVPDPEGDLEFDLDLGWRMKIPAARIRAIARDASVPAGVSEQIGASTTTAVGVASTQPAANPRVIPGPVFGSPLSLPGAVPVTAPTNPPFAGLVWIPPGTFTLGSSGRDAERDLDEGPPTQVVLETGFWMAKHEVTQREFEALMGNNPSHHLSDPSLPVEKVSWQDAAEFCRRLTTLKRGPSLPEGFEFRLPTEAEWEYACRAGTTTQFSFGDDPEGTRVHDFAWVDGNSESGTHIVGQKKPNAWGLYDMHGNVWEWCLDGWQGTLPGGTITNRPVRPEGTLRAARGGSWLYEAKFSRSANRDSYGVANRCSDLGFRVVLARSP